MFRRGGIDDICGLLVSVAHEQVGPPSPTGGSGSLATTSALLPSLTAPGQMQDGSLQATSLDTEASEQLSGWSTPPESTINIIDQVSIADTRCSTLHSVAFLKGVRKIGQVFAHHA